MFVTEGEANRWFLKSLWKQYRDCARCPLSETRGQVVFGDGHCGADLLVVGEAPGETEDKLGRAFVGKCGFVLRRALKIAGLEDEAFITNAVMCRPPKNRTPERIERLACQPRLVKVCEILRPRVILLVGRTAALWAGVKEVGANRGLLKRECWPELPGIARVRLQAVVLTYHPSWILRQETRRKKTTAIKMLVADLRKTRKALDRARERWPDQEPAEVATPKMFKKFSKKREAVYDKGAE